MQGHGGLEQLGFADVPKPDVEHEHDVLIDVRAAALNHLDLWTLRGLPGLSLSFPHTLGGDAAGVVEATGDGVTEVRPGDRVMVNPGLSCHACDYCYAGRHSLCPEYRLLGEHVPGTLTESIVVPEANIVRIPDLPAGHAPLSWAEAAAFSLVTLTAWHMLVTRAKVRAGEAVLIWGVGGGVSSAALRIAKLYNAFVIATSSSDRKLAWAEAHGADVVLNHHTDDVVKSVRAIREKRGVDVVIDNVGEATWERSLRLLGRGGRLVTCGATTGPRASIDIRRLFWYQWDILGSTMGGVQDYRDAVSVLSRGLLPPEIDSTFAFDEARAAFERLQGGDHLGKVVIEIGESGAVSRSHD